MAELSDNNMPIEYIGPLLSCFDILKNCNVWVFDEERTFIGRHLPSVYVIGSLMALYLSQTVYLIEAFSQKVEIKDIIFSVAVYIIVNQAILKAVIVIRKKEKIKTIVVELGKIWRDTDLTEKQIRDKNVLLKRLNFCYTAFYWVHVLSSWQYMTYPLGETIYRKCIKNEEESQFLLPFTYYYPFEVDNWLIYLVMLVFQIYSMFRVIFFLMGSEFTMITLCSHLSTEFTLLKEDLMELKPTRQTYNKIYTVHDRGYGLRDIIERHKTILGFAEDLNNIFNEMIFVNLSSASITICFFAFTGSMAKGAFELINNFMAVFALMTPIFTVCYYSEQLKESSLRIGDAAYENLWYNGDKNYRMAICFIIMRAQKPCCLTYLKHGKVTLTTFTSVMRNTWSYFNLASSMYTDEANLN